MCALTLPDRTTKPRSYGITSIQDKGLNTGELENILKDFHPFVDIAKMSIGTAYLTPRIEEKLKLYQQYDVIVYFGGTLFEKYYYQNKLEEYLNYLKTHNIKWIEVSNGTTDISLDERTELIQDLSDNFNILAEVGCKDSHVNLPPSEWMKEIQSLIEAGANFVITEGRGSGTAGIYNENGTIRTDLISDIISKIDTKKLIFETPKSKHQNYMINHVGTNVNLGNILPHDVLLVETQRVGLRNETFFLGQND